MDAIFKSTLARRPLSGQRQAGITLIELMVVVAVGVILITLAAPRFTEMIQLQRLRGVATQMTTDLQYARSEAAARNDFARIRFGQNASLTCYVIYTAPSDGVRCDCRLGAGAACNDPTAREIKTVIALRKDGVVLSTPTGGTPAPPSAFAFDPVTGGIWAIPTDLGKYPVELAGLVATIGGNRTLAALSNQAGRIVKCKPSGSVMSEVAC
jgi:type IV fimbrial biogenesis protein FimT